MVLECLYTFISFLSLALVHSSKDNVCCYVIVRLCLCPTPDSFSFLFSFVFSTLNDDRVRKAKRNSKELILDLFRSSNDSVHFCWPVMFE